MTYKHFIKTALFLTFIIININLFSQNNNVAVNNMNLSADSSAMLDVFSVNKGFLMPRLTTQQRNAIVSPAQSLQIYNTTTKCFEFWENGTWNIIKCAVSSPNPVLKSKVLNVETEVSSEFNIKNNIE